MMQPVSSRRFIAVLCAFVLCGLTLRTAAVRAEDDKITQIETAFRQAIDLYEQGKYVESQQKLKEMEDKDPRNEQVARLVDEAGTRIIVKMMADVRMGSEPTRLWEQYRKYNLGVLANKERMAKMSQRLVDANTSEEERLLLYVEFARLGQYAVPFLANHLKDPTNINARSYARIAIARMSQSAIPPLIELLQHSDPLMRENAILTMGDIIPADARAIPALKARLEDPKEIETVKNYANRVLNKISGLAAAQAKPAVASYYDLANRYYLDKAGVAEEAEDAGGLVWNLNETGDLVSTQYPLWAWNEQLAEKNIWRGLLIDPNNADFYALWACNNASMTSEVKDLLEISKEQPPRHNFSEEEKAQLEDWSKRMVDARRKIAAVGKENVNAALNKVHADLLKYPTHSRLPGIGVTLAQELENLDPKGETLDGASALAAGLESREISIQYACAVALADIDKFPGDWAGSDKVGALLGRGVSENKPLQVLLVEEDPEFANAFAGRIRSLGYGVSVADSGRTAVTMARAFPPKDVVIADEKMQRDLNTIQMTEELRAEVMTRYLPVGVLHEQAKRDLVQARFGSGMILVEREMPNDKVKEQIEKLGEQRVPAAANKRRSDEIAVLCAMTLNKVHPDATHINLNDAVKHAIGALIARKDDVRIPSAIFLGRVAGGAEKDAAADTLRRVFEDKNAVVELRRSALHSLGMVRREGLNDLYTKAQLEETDQGIKDIAAEALGQKSRDGRSILAALIAIRGDIEKSRGTAAPVTAPVGETPAAPPAVTPAVPAVPPVPAVPAEKKDEKKEETK